MQYSPRIMDTLSEIYMDDDTRDINVVARPFCRVWPAAYNH